jgi:hypothetical protein
MTNFDLTPALIDAVMDIYDDRTGGGYFGHSAVAPAWDYVLGCGFDGTLDELVAEVADFLVQED